MDNTTSIIQQNKDQASLFDVDDYLDKQAAEPGRNPVFTARRFFEKDPAKYFAIVKLSAVLGTHEIAERLKCSVHTVLVVQEKERDGVAREKQRLAERCLTGARLTLEEMIGRLLDTNERKKIPAACLGPWFGILVEKGELISGGATARIDHTTLAAPDADAWGNYLRSMKRADARLTGQGLEKNRAKEVSGSERSAPGLSAAAGPVLELAAGSAGAEVLEPGPAACGSGASVSVEELERIAGAAAAAVAPAALRLLSGGHLQ